MDSPMLQVEWAPRQSRYMRPPPPGNTVIPRKAREGGGWERCNQSEAGSGRRGGRWRVDAMERVFLNGSMG